MLQPIVMAEPMLTREHCICILIFNQKLAYVDLAD